MRSAFPLVAAGLALAVAGSAFAQGAGSTMSPSKGATTPPETSASPPAATDTSPTPPPAATEPAAPGAPAAATEGSNTSATAGAKSFTVGETVKDSSGASIGTITSLTGAGDAQMAVIKMGDQSFQVQANRLGSANGAAEINMTKAQISGMLKGGAAAK